MPGNSISQAKWPATIGFVAGILLLNSTVPTTFAFDKVYPSAILTLGILSCLLFLLPRVPFPAFLLSRTGSEEKGYSTVPLADLGESHPSRTSSPVRSMNQGAEYPSSLRKLRLCFLGLIAAVCFRVEILRLTVRNVECSGISWSPIIPLVFAFSDYWFHQRQRRGSADQRGFGQILQSPLAIPLATAGLAIAGVTGLAAATTQRSTYICPVTSPFFEFTPFVQHVGTFLDMVIILCLHVVSQSQESSSKGSGSPRFATVSYAAMTCATILTLVGAIIYFFSHPDDRQDIRRFHHLYLYSTLTFSVLSAFTLIYGVVAVHHFGLVSTTVFTATAGILGSATSFTLAHHGVYPSISSSLLLFAVFATIVSFTIFNRARHISDSNPSKATSRRSSFLYAILVVTLALHGVLWLFPSGIPSSHPIDTIITENELIHQTFAASASSSKSLSAAAEAYRKRYGRHPPPRFDEWYKYATERNSQILDMFDGLHEDILPYWSLPPQEIRDRTWSIVATPFNEAGAILIRGGVAQVHEGVRPTHRWMLDGVVDILKNFSEFLPDMDLAFNMNDECRVSVPYSVLHPMRQAATRDQPTSERPYNAFSTERQAQWKALPDPPVPDSESPLIELSWKNIFYEFGSAGCPPSSPARVQRLWDPTRLCTTCAALHSTQGILRDWKKAGDPCHQPDLADLHGMYIAPSAFKASDQLMPIFSQSKITGFNDILYPSAWNYIDKAKYEPSNEHPDPPFGEKNNSLIWRGATSEGLSAGKGQWQGMARQRFVHMTSRNYTTSQKLLVPRGEGEYHYQSVSGAAIAAGLTADVQIVNDIVRCHPQDCDQQYKEFDPLAQPMDFQDHWKYKYLLDLDGAGFSGRFLPFLKSGSLPFKAGLFREWWADRVTAWQHFVPLDIRGHGLWDTLAYFAGFEAPELDIHMAARDAQGEKIARQGQEWAEKVLRKEDMEIYFFRLLLEWGRLTDDDRDRIGYFG